jgi:2-oxoglutarate ferredoxin oxidoreductase subunit beta
MEKVFGKPLSYTGLPTDFCPGCGHGIVLRLVSEVLEELEIVDRTICVLPVGCGGYVSFDLGYDNVKALHGRAPAVATAIKRLRPENLVFTYQGDGDLAAEGMSEIVHAVARGEKFSVVFVNNATYGETGGQMGPTTLLGQKSSTYPLGRDSNKAGFPIKVAELLASLAAQSGLNPAYIVRRAVNNPQNTLKTRDAIRKSFQFQLEEKGFSLVEILSPCPPNWGLGPIQSMKWIEEKMTAYYPLGDFSFPDSEPKAAIDKENCR